MKQKFAFVSKTFFGMLVRVVACAIIGVMLLTLVYSIPIDSIDENVKKSAYTLENEGNSPQVFDWWFSPIDNYTDSYMLLEASYNGEESPLYKAMINNYNSLGDNNIFDTITTHYVNNKEYDGIVSYSRYWHGYLVLLKPLLVIFDYSSIRIINCIAQIGLIIALIILMIKKQLKEFIIPIILSWLCIMPIATVLCLQYSDCYYIFMISSIVILGSKGRINGKGEVLIFLYTGIATAFFDFLTYPLITFGIPAILYFCIHKQENSKRAICKVLKLLLFWGFGYVVMWASKWIIGSIITGKNILLEAKESIEVRASFSGPSSSPTLSKHPILGVYYRNIMCFVKTPAFILVSLFVVIMCIAILINIKKRKKHYSISFSSVLPFIILAIIPIFWYIVTVNHSSVHYYMTNKILTITVMSIMSLLVVIITQIKEKQKLNNCQMNDYDQNALY